MRLLKLIGSDPWAHGWQLLHQSPCLYIIFPYPLRCSRFGPLFYIGETTSFRRRMVEHLLRLIAQDGATQQPFYQVVRHNCCQGTQLLAALSFLMMLPVHLAPVDTGERLLAETALCHSLGTLNPPTVYSLLPKTKQRQVQGLRIFDSFRSLCRLRPSQPAAGEMSLSSSVGLIRKEWRDGLQKIAAALAGRRFEKSNAAALAAWNLSPGAWAYVARRVDQFETGWRRKRGLHLLGIISKKRRDLCPFVSSVAVSVPWMGSTSALRILRGEIRELLSAWRRKGHWVPIARHAKCFVSWTAPPTLADCLTSTSVLRQALEEGVSPQCICEAVRLQNPGWPVVTFDGCEHIAAPQGMVPWPEQLRHLARWPASIGLPPRFEDVVSAVRTSFRRLRNRCRIPISDSCTVEAVQRCCSSLWSLPVQDSRVPITWSHVGEAREWLQAQGVFVSVFDHNPSSLGVFCPKLVFEHACQLLDFLHHQKPDANFAWSVSDIGRQRDVLSGMANMSDLPSHLIPGLHTVVSKRQWCIATVSFLPKWKCPGLKWRLIVNKHYTPCCGLHSLVSRGLDILLDSFPRHLWSDYLSMGEVVSLVGDFNLHVQDYQFDVGCTAAADMKDCFRHLPCERFADMWDGLAAYWKGLGLSCVSVPHKRLGCRGILGRCDDPGWTCIDFASIRKILLAFATTNHVAIGSWLGREQHGAPQGDALSSALLRLWKWHREFHCGVAAVAESVPIPASKCKLLHLLQSNVLVLDVSYRDDLRMFFAWRSCSALTPDVVRSWAWVQWRQRFVVGTMSLDKADDNVFTGLQVAWDGAYISLRPCTSDPWAAHCYGETDNFPLKPWQSWAPPQQFKTAVRGLLCRSWYFSTSPAALREALWEVFVALVYRANFPWHFVRQHSKVWALSWVPKGELLPIPTLFSDVECVVGRFENSLVMIQP